MEDEASCLEYISYAECNERKKITVINDVRKTVTIARKRSFKWADRQTSPSSSG